MLIIIYTPQDAILKDPHNKFTGQRKRGSSLEGTPFFLKSHKTLNSKAFYFKTYKVRLSSSELLPMYSTELYGVQTKMNLQH